MPLLNVSEVLDDPMFRDDTGVVIRTTITTGSDGVGVPTTQTIPLVGPQYSTVYIAGFSANGPGGDGGLVRLPEGERAASGLSILTRFPIQVGDNTLGITADIVRWNNQDFTVTSINEFPNYGEGWYFAIAQQKRLNT